MSGSAAGDSGETPSSAGVNDDEIEDDDSAGDPQDDFVTPLERVPGRKSARLAPEQALKKASKPTRRRHTVAAKLANSRGWPVHIRVDITAQNGRRVSTALDPTHAFNACFEYATQLRLPLVAPSKLPAPGKVNDAGPQPHHGDEGLQPDGPSLAQSSGAAAQTRHGESPQPEAAASAPLASARPATDLATCFELLDLVSGLDAALSAPYPRAGGTRGPSPAALDADGSASDGCIQSLVLPGGDQLELLRQEAVSLGLQSLVPGLASGEWLAQSDDRAATEALKLRWRQRRFLEATRKSARAGFGLVTAGTARANALASRNHASSMVLDHVPYLTCVARAERARSQQQSSRRFRHYFDRALETSDLLDAMDDFAAAGAAAFRRTLPA